MDEPNQKRTPRADARLGQRRKPGRLIAFASLALFLGGLAAIAAPGSTPSSSTAAPLSPSFPTVAVLTTVPGGATTDLVIQPVGPNARLAGPVATVTHAEGGSAQGALLPGAAAAVVIADMINKGDLSWGAALFRIEPGQPQRELADRVYTGTRPLVLRDGRVLVQRGRAGIEPTPEEAFETGLLRIDEITIDEVDPTTGTLRTLHEYSGYIAFLAGAYGNEAFVYRVGPDHADIVAIDLKTASFRYLAPSLLPFARDFSVDPSSQSLLFTERAEESEDLWVVERIRLATGVRERLAAGPRMALFPHYWLGNQLVLNPDGESGLTLMGRNGALVRRLSPLGAGADQIQEIVANQEWAIGVHTQPSERPEPFVMHIASGNVERVPAEPGAWVEIVGVMP